MQSKCIRVCSSNEGKVVMVNKNQEKNPQHSHFLSQTDVVPSQKGKCFLLHFHMTSGGLEKLLLPHPGTRSIRGFSVSVPGWVSLASWMCGGLWAGSCSCSFLSVLSMHLDPWGAEQTLSLLHRGITPLIPYRIPYRTISN